MAGTSSKGMLCELKRRWVSVTEQFRKRQAEAIAGVTSKRDLGLTALLVVMTQWGDTCYPYGLITGLPAVGTAPCYNIRHNLGASSLWPR